MTGPDALVEVHGQQVTHELVTDYALDANGQVDPDSLETDTEEIQAIVSNPSDQDQRRHDGRLGTGSKRLTVPSDQDVSGSRGGRPDHFVVDGTRFVVVEVRDDVHPVTGTEKLTVLVEQLAGRHD